MLLQYGINSQGDWVYIDQVGRGKLDLHCPYCGGDLLAKKGNVKIHHFAHDGETCRAASLFVRLPAYDQFHLHIPSSLWNALQRFHAAKEVSRWELAALEAADLLTYNEYREEYSLTHAGKVPFGELSLPLFIEFQEPLLAEKHAELEEIVRQSRHTPDLPARLTDFQLYRAQWRRILTSTLYFLEIRHRDGILHKIGITTRTLASRVSEIQLELQPHLGATTIQVLDSWARRGNVELYFKHRYQRYQKRVGTLTEYFTLPDLKRILSYDLRRMKPKILTELEQEIAAGNSSQLERELAAEGIEQRRRVQIRAGMRRAKELGKPIGRPKGGEEADAFLTKPQTLKIREALAQGLSVRDAAQYAAVSPTTVQKVKKLLEQAE